MSKVAAPPPPREEVLRAARAQVERFTREVVSPAIAEKQRKLKQGYTNSGKKWQPSDDVDLMVRWRRREPLEATSDQLQRSPKSVEFHIEKIVTSTAIQSPLFRPVLDELSRIYGRSHEDIIRVMLINHGGQTLKILPRLPRILEGAV